MVRNFSGTSLPSKNLNSQMMKLPAYDFRGIGALNVWETKERTTEEFSELGEK